MHLNKKYKFSGIYDLRFKLQQYFFTSTSLQRSAFAQPDHEIKPVDERFTDIKIAMC